MKKQRINLTINDNVWQQLKIRAIEEKKSVSQLLEEIAKKHLEKVKH